MNMKITREKNGKGQPRAKGDNMEKGFASALTVGVMLTGFSLCLVFEGFTGMAQTRQKEEALFASVVTDAGAVPCNICTSDMMYTRVAITAQDYDAYSSGELREQRTSEVRR